jgi:sugar lactone lactonase YvrE
MVFSSKCEGTFLGQFGTVGYNAGEFDEPVGLAISSEGIVYVADTWNRRIQALVADSTGTFRPLSSWDIYGWESTSIENKPYLTINPLNGHIFATDPEGYRVLEFTPDGELVRYFGIYSSMLDGFNIPIGLAFDQSGGLWVADSGNNRILYFKLP